ncbi:terminase large subunit [Rhizobium sp. PL01]|uniref:terminase large subunit n=1 Tax=Rhizobium sp. PL01 TaxID=3085631 RepID=UPI002981D51D|nr:terminase TerL endonuclease subunit [Rhizobium sp. PL01]MDW5313773.1 terminase TerL endonuclease subunit [Rhizobium sp. PL01]
MVKLILPPKPKKKTTYPDWIFDNSPIADPLGYGERAVKFLQALKHPKNPLPGHHFQLDPWQERIVRAIYGPRNEDGTRIVRTVVLLLPRGNRKTSLAAALALLHTFGPERTPGGEIMSAASDRSQAKLTFDEIQGVVRAMPQIDEIARIADYKHRITNDRHKSFFTCVSSDAGSAHGHTPTTAIVDELHAHKKRHLWDAIRSGLPKTKNSLLIITTTAGRGQENLAFEQIDYARKVAKGEIIDPATLPILFETPADADWQDEAVWYRANPGLAHGYPDIEGLRQLAREAAERPGDREAFRQYHLNTWMDHSAAAFVEMSTFDRGSKPFDLADLKGQPCWLGVDLSSTSDLTAVVAAWRDGNDGYIVKPWFFCPKDNLDRRTQQSGYPYSQWAVDEFLMPTSGNVVDIRAVENHIRDLCERFEVREIAFDPHYARITMANLVEDGYPCVEFRQGWATMGPAIQTLEKSILSRKFQHGGHPILRWNFDNVVKRLGFTAVDLKRKLQDPSALFSEIIGKLGQLDKAAQIRVADEIFGGTGGEKFVQLIAQGEDGIRKTVQQAHDLGLVLNEEVIARADEIDRKFNAIAGTVGSALKKAVVDVVGAMDDWLDRMNKLDEQTTRNIQSQLVGTYDKIKEAKDLLSELQLDKAAFPEDAGIDLNIDRQKATLEELTEQALKLRDNHITNTFSPTIPITVQASGNKETDGALADRLSKEMETLMDNKMVDFTQNQQRPGNMMSKSRFV